MAAAPVNFPNAGHFYSNITKPVKIDLQFTVDNTNGNGITSLKSNGYVQNVFMNCATTASAANPNPAAGFAIIQLAGNYNVYLDKSWSVTAPPANATTAVTSGLTAGNVYIITVLGTTTLAEWQSIGLPKGLTPTVGQAFVATATGTGGSHTGKVGTPDVSPIVKISEIGTPNTTLSNSNVSANGGGQILVQFMAATNSSTTTLVATAPAASSVVRMSLALDASSVTVDGL